MPAPRHTCPEQGLFCRNPPTSTVSEQLYSWHSRRRTPAPPQPQIRSAMLPSADYRPREKLTNSFKPNVLPSPIVGRQFGS
jgi:hypothetical protein